MFAIGQKVRSSAPGLAVGQEGTVAQVHAGGWYSIAFGTRGFSREVREQFLEAVSVPAPDAPAELPPVVIPPIVIDGGISQTLLDQNDRDVADREE
jgi:hypothetical protein